MSRAIKNFRQKLKSKALLKYIFSNRDIQSVEFVELAIKHKKMSVNFFSAKM
jgi:hypothetical protein